MIDRVKQFFSATTILLLILVFAAGTRLWRLDFPHQYYFDEVYHVVTAKLMARNNPAAYEWWHPAPEPNTAIDWLHPPLAKLMQAGSIAVLGDSSGVWRLSSALLGVGVIGLTYALARKLRFSPSVSVLAAGLASFDGLLLAMSRITMNDIHVTFFIVLTLWLYLHWREKPSWWRALLVGISAGAAAASKWSGIFVVAPIAFDQVRLLMQSRIQHQKFQWGNSLWLWLSLIVGIPAMYLGSYGQMFLQGHSWDHFVQLHHQIWWYQTNLTATHPYQSTPWEWLLDLRPVYTYTSNPGPSLMQHMYIQGNPLLLWAGLAAVLWTISSFIVWGGSWVQLALDTLGAKNKKNLTEIKKKFVLLQKQTGAAESLLFLLVAYFSMWIVWTNSPRIMFFYHYTPALPFLFILLSYWLVKLWQHSLWGKYVSVSFIALAFLTFILFFPNWTGLVMPQSPWSSLYFALPSWR